MGSDDEQSWTCHICSSYAPLVLRKLEKGGFWVYLLCIFEEIQNIPYADDENVTLPNRCVHVVMVLFF